MPVSCVFTSFFLTFPFRPTARVQLTPPLSLLFSICYVPASSLHPGPKSYSLLQLSSRSSGIIVPSSSQSLSSTHGFFLSSSSCPIPHVLSSHFHWISGVLYSYPTRAYGAGKVPQSSMTSPRIFESFTATAGGSVYKCCRAPTPGAIRAGLHHPLGMACQARRVTPQS
jgi:hypothetical protein